MTTVRSQPLIQSLIAVDFAIFVGILIPSSRNELRTYITAEKRSFISSLLYRTWITPIMTENVPSRQIQIVRSNGLMCNSKLTMLVSWMIRKLGHGTGTTLSTERFDTQCRRFHLLMVTVKRENWRISVGSRASERASNFYIQLTSLTNVFVLERYICLPVNLALLSSMASENRI